MAAPEDWTGRQVRVRLDVTGSDVVLGVLEQVSDRGIVLRYRIQPEGERPIFYPWRLVRWIYPVEEPEGEDEGLQMGSAW